MKKRLIICLLSVFFAFIAAFTLSACGGNESNGETSSPESIIESPDSTGEENNTDSAADSSDRDDWFDIKL